MLQKFYASPADMKTLFQEIEQKLNICYTWGFSVPCIDALNVFNSCDQIDCFGYALDSTYWLDIHFRDMKLNLVQNDHGYYFSNERIQLHICNTATKALPDRALVMNELYCPPGAEKQNKNLFLAIKRAMGKKWEKVNGILYGPDVFRERERLLFLGDTIFSFSGREQYTTSLDTWYDSLTPEIKTIPFLCPPPKSEMNFYATTHDMLAYFQQLESQVSMRYWCGKESIRYEHFHQLFFERLRDDKSTKTIHAIDMCTRNIVDVTLSGLRTNIKDVVVPGMVTYMGGCPKYGGTLHRKLNRLFEMLFKTVSIKHYGIYYLGPEIYQKRDHIIFDNGDPRFKCVNNEFVNVWRNEWDQIQGP